MAQFVLLDHSLKRVGGHHYDYAIHVLGAADSLGFETVLASHRVFSDRSRLPAGCRLFPVFRKHTYTKHSEITGTHGALTKDEDRKETTSRSTSSWTGFRDRMTDSVGLLDRARHAFGRRKRIRLFTADCARLFRRLRLARGDQVFIPTLSELELLGLARFLKSSPNTRLADWHLQFHFNIFVGREPDYEQQRDHLQLVRSRFDQAIRTMPNHRLHFYNTSELLTEQYNQLGVATFEPLAYPINPRLRVGHDDPKPARPLRIVCAGGLRAEKGFDRLTTLASELWDPLLRTGKIQMVVQSKRERFSSQPRVRLPLPEGELAGDDRDDAPDTTAPVEYVHFPLETQEYATLIQSAHIGLFQYDSEPYYTRRAGILGEYLAVGVPVIVPAGCWLSGQIAEANFAHAESAAEKLITVAQFQRGDLQWEAPTMEVSSTALAEDSIPFGDASASASTEIQVPTGVTHLHFRYDRSEPAEPGIYVRLEIEQFTAAGERLRSYVTILERRGGGRSDCALARVPGNCHTIRARLQNAYHDSPVRISNPRFNLLSAAGLPGGDFPLGAVGLIAGDVGQLPELIGDMVEHYDHYRGTARAFSDSWYAAHDPRLTITQLLERAHQRPSAAATRAA